MANIHHSISELVGRTPLVEFDNYEKELGLEAHLLGKLEYFNPSGSVKDRAALNMIVEAEKRGDLKPGDTILDFTSGNTGIATAAFANARGYKYAVVIQPGVSRERTLILNAYGVTLLQASDVPGFAEMLANGGLTMKKLKPIMEAYAKEHGYYYIDQGNNQDNPDVHYGFTGPEIWEDTDGKVDIFVAGVGTGGTVTGVGEYLKSQNPNVKVVAVEPASSPVLSKGTAGAHKIQGIGAGFVPDVLDTKVYDEIIAVENEDAFAVGRLIGHKEGVLVGISSGAAVWAAIQLAKRPENAGKNIVVLLPDTGDRYLSTPLFAE